jgi:hypothetical protein
MSQSISRHVILPAVLAVALALPAAAQDAHHPPSTTTRPPSTQPAQPHGGQPSAPGHTMGGDMMQMMHRMMSRMSQDRGEMHRMGMMGLGGMGLMMAMRGPAGGHAIEHVEGHIAFLRAELKITDAQAKAWDEFAAAIRANAKQLNDMRVELAKADTADTSPVARMERQEKILTARLEIVRRTKPALLALYSALSDNQKKSLAELTSHRMMMR